MRIYNNKNLESYKKFANLALFTFIVNFPNFILTTLAAIKSSTIVVWIDTLVTLSETLHSLIIWIVALKMCKENGDKYNFGMDRLEVFISFLCELLITLGMAGMLFGAIWNIIYPVAPTSTIGYFCIMKGSCVSFDIYIYIKQANICKANPSKINKSEKNTYLISLINDAVMGVIAIICYFFRTYTFVEYFSPISSVILALYFIIGYVKSMKVSIGEIIDVSLPVKKQDEIYDIVMSNHEIIKKIISVNCRQLNNKAHIEISLIMHDNVKYTDMQQYLNEVRQKIEEIEQNSEVVLVIGNNF